MEKKSQKCLFTDKHTTVISATAISTFVMEPVAVRRKNMTDPHCLQCQWLNRMFSNKKRQIQMPEVQSSLS